MIPRYWILSGEIKSTVTTEMKHAVSACLQSVAERELRDCAKMYLYALPEYWKSDAFIFTHRGLLYLYLSLFEIDAGRKIIR